MSRAEFAKAAREQRRVIGMFALMTTTMLNMKKVIDSLVASNYRTRSR